MTNDDMPLGSTKTERVLGILGNNAKWYRYLQEPVAGIGAFVPLIRDKREMDRVAKEVVRYNKELPSDQRLDPRNNDTYFHQHAMYEAAQQGIWSALMAALAGELKEEYLDKPKKIDKGDSIEEIEEDSRKDLKNNYFAIRMGLESNRPVDEVIIPNPTIQKIREMRNAKK